MPKVTTGHCFAKWTPCTGKVYHSFEQLTLGHFPRPQNSLIKLAVCGARHYVLYLAALSRLAAILLSATLSYTSQGNESRFQAISDGDRLTLLEVLIVETAGFTNGPGRK